jgi:uncharacterized UPF0160 family protein
VIDVGATYEPEKNRFDHHQRGFEEVFGHGFVTKLSSAGLVYKHFGREIVANVLGLDEKDERWRRSTSRCTRRSSKPLTRWTTA